MSIKSDLDELQWLEAAAPDIDATGLSALPTIAAVFAYIAAAAKADGRDPADDVELLARHSNTSAPETRKIAATLRKLGFKAPAERLFMIAGRRKHSLRPLENGHTGE